MQNLPNNGADTKSRTRDLLITSQLLYQLSYVGVRFHTSSEASSSLANIWHDTSAFSLFLLKSTKYLVRLLIIQPL